MHSKTLTGSLLALAAAALTLSLSLATPAQARGGEAVDRFAKSAGNHQIQTGDTQVRQTADSESGVFFDVGVSQTVETQRLKRRKWKR